MKKVITRDDISKFRILPGFPVSCAFLLIVENIKDLLVKKDKILVELNERGEYVWVTLSTVCWTVTGLEWVEQTYEVVGKKAIRGIDCFV